MWRVASILEILAAVAPIVGTLACVLLAFMCVDDDPTKAMVYALLALVAAVLMKGSDS